jgi:hypothetical protein
MIVNKTHNINPSPSRTHIISGTEPNDYYCNDNASNASDENAHDTLANCRTISLPSFLIKAPYPLEELRIGQNAQDDGVCSECQVIEFHRGSKAMVAQRILLSDDWRVQKCNIRSEVCKKTKYVDDGKVNRGSGRRFSPEVEERLRVKGQGPGYGIDPAEDLRQDFKKRGHCYCRCIVVGMPDLSGKYNQSSTLWRLRQTRMTCRG